MHPPYHTHTLTRQGLYADGRFFSNKIVSFWLAELVARPPLSHGWIHGTENGLCEWWWWLHDMGRQIAEYYIFHVCCGRIFFAGRKQFSSPSRACERRMIGHILRFRTAVTFCTFEEGLRLYSCIRDISSRGRNQHTDTTQTDLYWQIYINTYIKTICEKEKPYARMVLFSILPIIEKKRNYTIQMAIGIKKRQKYFQLKCLLFEC